MLIYPSTESRVVASIQEHTDRQTDNKTGTKHKTTNAHKQQHDHHHHDNNNTTNPCLNKTSCRPTTKLSRSCPTTQHTNVHIPTPTTTQTTTTNNETQQQQSNQTTVHSNPLTKSTNQTTPNQTTTQPHTFQQWTEKTDTWTAYKPWALSTP